MNSAKAYLNQVRLLDRKIAQKIEERDELRAIAAGIGSPSVDPDKVQISPDPDRMERAIIRYTDLAGEIDRMIDEYVDLKDRIINQIHELEDPRYVELLYLRYVKYMRLEEIAVKMHYSLPWIKYLHGEALETFKTIHKHTF